MHGSDGRGGATSATLKAASALQRPESAEGGQRRLAELSAAVRDLEAENKRLREEVPSSLPPTGSAVPTLNGAPLAVIDAPLPPASHRPHPVLVTSPALRGDLHRQCSFRGRTAAELWETTLKVLKSSRRSAPHPASLQHSPGRRRAQSCASALDGPGQGGVRCGTK